MNDKAKVNVGIVEALARFNEERGHDSFGLFSSMGVIKRVGRIGGGGFPRAWIAANKKSRYMVGHTRFATRGDVTRKNTHPFAYDRAHKVMGSHNGVVPAPREYVVDSMWLFDVLASDGVEGLKSLHGRGSWGLAFVLDGEFYLAASNQELAVCVVDGVLYFSSDIFHLEQACGWSGVECYDLDDVIVKITEDGEFEVTELGSKAVESYVSADVSDFGWAWSDYETVGTTTVGDDDDVDEYEFDSRLEAWREYEGTGLDWIRDEAPACRLDDYGYDRYGYDRDWYADADDYEKFKDQILENALGNCNWRR